ncbi:SNF1-related protein kinase 2.6 [Klebsormidium nitens]|uniref:SNF1-related protein kinase 2.6 n=1 Tax=Klebsormidium nitens TaxID=105231 RepID=A0A1Y1I3Z9_KLENI|nr:SNF1-related protein kinase 2.6 [Klebsormidium nitens]|eukprot:GAQ82828.1 SNF1-related protein kinase 2.6 [Klebsormidium nitens]
MNPPYKLEPYEFVGLLGGGRFGTVQRMRDKRSGREVAIKFLVGGTKIDERVEREILVHRRLRHPCIPRLLEVRLTLYHLAIVMEFVEGTTLLQNLSERPHHRFAERQARFIFHQLVAIVNYLHSQGICHRDLSGNNILLKWVKVSEASKPYPVVYVCDFGMAKMEGVHSTPNSYIGTAEFVAPELLDVTAMTEGKEYDGQRADVWSMAVILLVMLTGISPFADPEAPHDQIRLFNRIRQGVYVTPQGVSPECLHFLACTLRTKPLERPSIDQLREHPWLQKDKDVAAAGYHMDDNDRYPIMAFQSEDEMRRIVHAARVINLPATSVR